MRLPNGYGSVVKLSGNRRRPFMARKTAGWTDEAKQLYTIIGYFAKKAEALAALAEYNTSPFDQKARGMSFKEVAELWEKERIESGLSYSNQYKAALGRLSTLNDRLFVELKAKDYQQVINSCEMGYATKKAIRIVASLINKFAIANGIVSVNYASLAKLPAQTDSTLHKPFSDKELQTLWEHSDNLGVQTVLVYIYTGFRATEFLKVRKENVFLNERYMLGGLKTSAGRNRAVPIAEKIYPFIEAMYNRSQGDFLFENDGGPLSYDFYRNHIFNRVMRDFSMDHLPHDCRHTCATMLDNAGVNPKICKLILGHSSNDVTQKVYTHKTISQLVEAINKI